MRSHRVLRFPHRTVPFRMYFAYALGCGLRISSIAVDGYNHLASEGAPKASTALVDATWSIELRCMSGAMRIWYQQMLPDSLRSYAKIYPQIPHCYGVKLVRMLATSVCMLYIRRGHRSVEQIFRPERAIVVTNTAIGPIRTVFKTFSYTPLAIITVADRAPSHAWRANEQLAPVGDAMDRRRVRIVHRRLPGGHSRRRACPSTVLSAVPGRAPSPDEIGSFRRTGYRPFCVPWL